MLISLFLVELHNENYQSFKLCAIVPFIVKLAMNMFKNIYNSRWEDWDSKSMFDNRSNVRIRQPSHCHAPFWSAEKKETTWIGAESRHADSEVWSLSPCSWWKPKFKPMLLHSLAENPYERKEGPYTTSKKNRPTWTDLASATLEIRNRKNKYTIVHHVRV